MILPDIKPEWRTQTVVEICQSMREAQDWSAMPILADALQDADCDDEKLLAELRKGGGGYAQRAGLVACVMSEETADAVKWLSEFSEGRSCPEYETLVAAATDNHHENGDSEDSYIHSRNDGGYLHFGGRDAHGDIPAEFWEQVQKATGKRIDTGGRAASFSCSC